MVSKEEAVEARDEEDWLLPVPQFFEEGPEVGEEQESKKAKPSAASRRQQRRAEKAVARAAHDKAHTRELRAVSDVLQALPQALPGLAACDGVKRLKVLAGDGATGSRQTSAPGEGESSLAASSRPSRKYTPDVQEVEEALAAAEASLRTEQPYRSLQEVFGPPGGFDVLAAMVDRPPKYQEKYLAQEWSILAKVWALARGSDAAADGGGLAIVDIGAGNGCLALLAAILLGGHAVLVDHTLPPEPLRVEDKVPEPYRSRVLRVTGDVADLDASREIEPLLAQHGIRQVIVIAKHLCGVGTDLALRLVRRWCQGGLADAGAQGGSEARAAVLGAVFATCCGHKIGAADRELYAGIHAEDPYLHSMTSGNPEHLLQFLSICTRCVAWRTTAGALANRITEAQVKTAELFEDALQQPRLNMLKKLFPSATEVAFVPQGQSPQNRCLVAGSEAGVSLAMDTREGEAASKALAALTAARDELLAVNGGALDLKPHGFVSTRYDYDGR